MKKKIISLALFFLCVGFVFVGCKDKGENRNWEPDAKITWWLVGGVEEYYQYYWSEMKSWQEIQRNTKVEIEFKVAINYEAYLPMMSAKTYPHVITAWNNSKYPGRMAALYDEGVSIALNDYIDEYMPNYKKMLEEYPQVAQDIRFNDGSYTFAATYYDVNDIDQRAVAAKNGLFLRGDWLDTVDKEVPTNMAEWYDVLKSFRVSDPNNNGVQDEEPYVACSSGWKYFLVAYGIDDDPSVMVDENGEEYVVLGYKTPNYKEYLEEMNKWYEEELIHCMFEDVSLEKQRERVTEGFAGSWKGYIYHIDETNAESFINALRETNPEAEIVPAPWPKTEDGYQWCFTDICSYHNDSTVVTSNAVKDGVDIAAVKVIDYLLSEEGSNLLVWGIEGESYEVVGGEKKLIDGMNEMVDFYGTDIPQISKYADNITVAFPARGDIVADFVFNQKSEKYINTCYTWSTGDTSYKMQAPCQLSVEQQRQADVMEDEMLNYMSKMRHRFITGQIPLTSYDSYLEQCNLLRAEEYTAIWQEAYDQYKAR